MQNTRYEIIVEFLNNGVLTRNTLDTYPPDQMENIELNFAINDINDISSRDSSYSKTITLPETDNNRQIFGFISNLNSNAITFNPNRRTKCYIYVDTILVMEGYLQLKNVKPNYRTGETKLECVVYSSQIDFFKSIGESYLQDLRSFNGLSYSYSLNNIVKSWSIDQNSTDIYYPLIDYGIGYDNLLNEVSTNFTASTIGCIGNDFVKANQIYPGVYLKTIVDSIFRSATYSGTGASFSYQYDSNFFNSDYFKNLFIPYANGLLTQKTNISSIPTISSTSSYVFNIDNSFYNLIPTSGNSFVSTTVGLDDIPIFRYILSSSTNVKFNLNFSANLHSNNYVDITQVSLIISIFVVQNAQFQDTSFDPKPIILDRKNFTFTTTSPADMLLTYSTSIINPPNYTFNQGDGFYVELEGDPNNVFPIDWSFQLNNINISISGITDRLVDMPIQLNTPFFINEILPSNIKQKDFLKSLFTLFNLYVEPSKEYPSILRIEPRDDYYYFNGPTSSIVIKDWTSKVDINEDINIQILAETQNKTVVLTYKEDKDYFNEDYQKQTNYIYGNKIIEIDNDFTVDTNTIDVLFGPCVLANIPGTSNFPIPNFTKQIDTTTNVPSGKSGCNVKLLQRGQIIGTSSTNAGQYLGPTAISLNPLGPSYSNDYWRLGTTQSDSLIFSYYPYSGNLNDPFIGYKYPNLVTDLNFDTSIYTYYNNGNIIPKNNLYNTFYKNQFDEITDINSKIITCKIYLTPQDIYTFKFSDVIYIMLGGNGNYYHVNKISNYVISEPMTCDVELIKIKNISSMPL
jgi:hypothetical protein